MQLKLLVLFCTVSSFSQLVKVELFCTVSSFSKLVKVCLTHCILISNEDETNSTVGGSDIIIGMYYFPLLLVASLLFRPFVLLALESCSFLNCGSNAHVLVFKGKPTEWLLWRLVKRTSILLSAMRYRLFHFEPYWNIHLKYMIIQILNPSGNSSTYDVFSFVNYVETVIKSMYGYLFKICYFSHNTREDGSNDKMDGDESSKVCSLVVLALICIYIRWFWWLAHGYMSFLGSACMCACCVPLKKTASCDLCLFLYSLCSDKKRVTLGCACKRACVVLPPSKNVRDLRIGQSQVFKILTNNIYKNKLF